eukprot:1532244-Prymnesium_polylepis.1
MVSLKRGGKSLGLVMDARNAIVELVPDSAAAGTADLAEPNLRLRPALLRLWLGRPKPCAPGRPYSASSALLLACSLT